MLQNTFKSCTTRKNRLVLNRVQQGVVKNLLAPIFSDIQMQFTTTVNDIIDINNRLCTSVKGTTTI